MRINTQYNTHTDTLYVVYCYINIWQQYNTVLIVLTNDYTDTVIFSTDCY